MLKRPGVFLMLALLLVCGSLKAGAEPVPGVNGASSTTESSPAADKNGGKASEQDGQSALELALKTINLSQGEGGIELWRLKAEWANMQKENGTIVVQRPTLTYFMPEKDKTLFVTSDSGIIDQKEQILRFIDHVHISQEDKSIRGSLLIYNGTAKTMTFPQGGEFAGTGVSGDASFVVWDMNHKVIRAEGGVSVRFAGSESPALSTPEQGK